MRYVLVFTPNSGAYRCHAENCSAATEQGMAKGYARRYTLDKRFNSIAEARAFADADESEKAGEPVKATGFKACKCTRN